MGADRQLKAHVAGQLGGIAGLVSRLMSMIFSPSSRLIVVWKSPSAPTRNFLLVDQSPLRRGWWFPRAAARRH